MKVAALFVGQGSETPGMGLELAERSPAAARLLDAAGEAAKVDMGRVLRGHPALARTEVLQPALAAVGLGAFDALRAAGVEVEVTLGHSAGEVPAAAAAGLFDLEDAIELAAYRGALMAACARRTPGGMLALNARSRWQLRAALRFGRTVGPVDVAAHNAPLRFALTGAVPALRQISDRFPSTMLRVAGPWHSPMMGPAVPDLLQALHRAGRRPPRSRATFISDRADAPIDLHLARQLVRPLHFPRILARVIGEGVTDLIIVGPGKTAQRLLEANVGRTIDVHRTDTWADLERTKESLQP